MKKNNNESEINKIHHHHLFSGFNKYDKDLIYHKKRNKDISSFFNKNKFSKNSSKNKYSASKVKNFSSNNIFNSKNNLIKNICPEKNTKLISKEKNLKNNILN